MSLLKCVIVASSVLALSTAAFAFQEQKAGSAPAPAAAEAPAKAVELAAPGTPDLKPSVGTEVRIPGLGKLGNLPKMDFGLELLYGATESKAPESQSREEGRDDLTIRGTVKHNF